nr:AraC family transcriptional regulator [Fodinicola feengrottensis]
MHRVAVLALEAVIPFELGIPSRIFGAATGPGGEPLYEVVTCTLDGQPVTSDAGYTIGTDLDATALTSANTVIIAPFHTPPSRTNQPRLAAALASIAPGTRIVSICTAAYVLAAAGLLDGREATTHWAEADHFQAMFPLVKVEPAALYVDNGDVLTSAGGAAGVDLCLHLVRQDHGGAVANRGRPATVWCHRGGTVARRSTSSCRCQRPRPRAPRRQGPGRWKIFTGHCRCPPWQAGPG